MYGFALITYHSQLVLVGGKNYVGENIKEQPSKKLWTLSEHGQWQANLPPMETIFHLDISAVSHGIYILVCGIIMISKVSVCVFNGHQWTKGPPPPVQMSRLNSAIGNGYWYLIGWPTVYCASLDSFVASCQPSETSQPSSVWQKLPDVRSGRWYPAVFGNRLVTLGPSAIDAYSTFTESWIHVGNPPGNIDSKHLQAAILPSDELMIVTKMGAFRATLTSKCSVAKLCDLYQLIHTLL